MSDSSLTLVVVGAAVVLFASGRLAPELVGVGAAVALYAVGVIGADQAVAGFGDPAVVFIASLFVVGEALDGSGVTAWAGQMLVARAGGSVRMLVVALLVLVAVLSALITPNGAVAALVPVAVVIARRVGVAPSRLLIPVAFSASAGALLALTGSPVNVIVWEASIESGHGGFGFLSFALVGVPLVLGTVAIVVLAGERLLPERDPRTIASIALSAGSVGSPQREVVSVHARQPDGHSGVWSLLTGHDPCSVRVPRALRASCGGHEREHDSGGQVLAGDRASAPPEAVRAR